jgi:hypothetical protein
MDTSESKVHSFIVKLWQETEGTGKGKWHGYITHVPDAGRRYFKDLHEIVSFIKPYLANGENSTSPSWLSRLKRFGRKR